VPTHDELRTRLRTWLATDSVALSDAICTDILNLIIGQLTRTVDVRFCETSGTQATAAGTASYALPTRYSRSFRLWYTASDLSVVDLKQIFDFAEFKRLHPDATETSGDLEHFTIYGGNIYIGPTPNAIITLNHDFYQYLADLSAGGDSNDFTTTQGWWQVLLFKACAYASTHLLEDGRGPMFDQMANEIFQTISVEHSRFRHSAGSLDAEEP
jgi:hypothetical protein